MENKKNRIYISTLVIFWITFAFFILVVSNILVMNLIDQFNRFLFFFSAFVLPCLGIALIVLASKAKFIKISKAFFILTGASATGIVVSAILHNVFYGIFIYFFGADFWYRIGTSDEPVFFILAIIVCPIAFLIGVVGSIVLIVKKKIITQ